MSVNLRNSLIIHPTFQLEYEGGALEQGMCCLTLILKFYFH